MLENLAFGCRLGSNPCAVELVFGGDVVGVGVSVAHQHIEGALTTFQHPLSVLLDQGLALRIGS